MFTSYCSIDMAVRLAKQSRQMASNMYIRDRTTFNGAAESNIIGVACTASIVTDKAKKGAHKCFVAVAKEYSVSTYSLMMEKGKRDRIGEDKMCADLILQAIFDNTFKAEIVRERRD